MHPGAGCQHGAGVQLDGGGQPGRQAAHRVTPLVLQADAPGHHPVDARPGLRMWHLSCTVATMPLNCSLCPCMEIPNSQQTRHQEALSWCKPSQHFSSIS